jgi:hypothetical protein
MMQKRKRTPPLHNKTTFMSYLDLIIVVPSANSMELNACEASSHLARQKILSLLWNLVVDYHVNGTVTGAVLFSSQ